jgi:hypothetical protein
LRFIPGEVPFPPFASWAQSDDVLASTASLLKGFHDATVGFVAPENATWSAEMADAPRGERNRGERNGAEVICHNDVCPENVVYRAGRAVALLDFDFAAPGSRVYDLARLALMQVPIDAPEDAARTGRGGLDPFVRLRVVADGYGLGPDRVALVDALERNVEAGGAFLQRRVDLGEEAFLAMRDQMGGMARYDRRRTWFADHRGRFLECVG